MPPLYVPTPDTLLAWREEERRRRERERRLEDYVRSRQERPLGGEGLIPGFREDLFGEFLGRTGLNLVERGVTDPARSTILAGKELVQDPSLPRLGEFAKSLTGLGPLAPARTAVEALVNKDPFRLVTGIPGISGLIEVGGAAAEATSEVAGLEWDAYLRQYKEQGSWRFTEDGRWVKQGPTAYDPLNPADIPQRRKLEGKLKDDLRAYMGRWPTDDELVVALVQLGHIPTPSTAAFPKPGTPALRDFLSIPAPQYFLGGGGAIQDRSAQRFGRGAPEVNKALVEFLYSQDAKLAPDRLGRFGESIMDSLELFDKGVVGAGRLTGEGIAQGIEHTARTQNYLSTGRYELPPGVENISGKFRGEVPARVLGELEALIVPGIGFGPKGFLKLTQAVARSPLTAARVIRRVGEVGPAEAALEAARPLASRDEVVGYIRVLKMQNERVYGPARERLAGRAPQLAETAPSRRVRGDVERRGLYLFDITGGYTENDLDLMARGLDPVRDLAAPSPEYTAAEQAVTGYDTELSRLGDDVEKLMDSSRTIGENVEKALEANSVLRRQIAIKENELTAEMQQLVELEPKLAEILPLREDASVGLRRHSNVYKKYSDRIAGFEMLQSDISRLNKALTRSDARLAAAEGKAAKVRDAVGQLQRRQQNIRERVAAALHLSSPDEVPTHLEDWIERLRHIHIPGYEEALRTKPTLPVDEALRLQSQVGEAKAAQKAKDLGRLTVGDEELRALEELEQAYLSGQVTNLPRGGLVALKDFGELYSKMLQAREAVRRGPVMKPRVAQETLTNLVESLRVAAIADAGGDLRKLDVEVRAEVIDALRKGIPTREGKSVPVIVYRRLPDGTEEAGRIVSIDLPKNLLGKLDDVKVLVRPVVSTTGAYDRTVPLAELYLKYGPENTEALRLRSVFHQATEERVAQLPQPADFVAALEDVLKPPEISAWEAVKTAEVLQEELRAAQEAVERMTATPVMDSTARQITEMTNDYRKGGWLFQAAEPPKGKRAREEWLESMDRVTRDVQAVLEENGVVLDDPYVQTLIKEVGSDDPRKALFLTMTRMAKNEILNRVDQMPMPRLLREVVNFTAGRVIDHPVVLGLLQQYYAMERVGALYVDVIFGNLKMTARKFALEQFGKPADETLRLTSAGEKELQALLGRHFDYAGTDFTQVKFQALLERLPEHVRPDFIADSAKNWLTFVTYPDLFPRAPKELKDIALFWQVYQQRLDDMARVLGVGQLSKASMNRAMLARELRTYAADLPDAGLKALSEGPLETVAWAVDFASRNPNFRRKSLAELVTQADDRAFAYPMATWRSILNARTADAIRGLATVPNKVPREAVVRMGDLWSIRQLDLWPTELQNSLKEFSKIMEGTNPWRGLSEFGQSIATGVLMMDMNVLSLQGLSTLTLKATHALATAVADVATGHPLRLGKGLTALVKWPQNVMALTGDIGWHAWLRNNIDEISYYVANGLTTGMEAYLGGLPEGKLIIERAPLLIGKVFGAVHSFNDLQFARWVLALKVMGVRENLWAAKMLRSMAPQSAIRTIRAVPNLRSMAEQAGGEAAFLYGQPESVVRAAVRQIQNQLGGVDMRAQGVGGQRRAAEIFLTIVPSFLRAQAGWLTTALTKPHTVEGWMAIQGMAREVMFASAVSYGLSTLTGNNHKWNWYDPRRADWMAIQTDGGYLPVIPRMGLYRLFSRAVGEVVDAARGQGFDPRYAIESFVEGRLSPIVGTTYQVAVKEQDFLGRNYTSIQDKAIAGLMGIMPLVLENVVQDTREHIRQYGVGSHLIETVTRDVPLQILGRNYVPRHPLGKLNEYSQERWGQDWFDLTELKRDESRKDANVVTWEAEYDYWRKRRASDTEEAIDLQFKETEERVNQLRTGPVRFPDGQTMTFAEATLLLDAGRIDGDKWRDYYHYINQQAASIRDEMELDLADLGIDLDERREAKVEKFEKSHDPADALDLAQMLLYEYQSVSPDDPRFQRTVTIETADGPIRITETDWDAFFAARDAVRDRYPEEVYELARPRLRSWEDSGIVRYRKAGEQRRTIEEIPRYRGLSLEAGTKVDVMRKAFGDLTDVIVERVGVPLGMMPEGTSKAIRAAALQDFIRKGFIKNREDAMLAVVAIAMEENSELREVMRNPVQVDALIANPDVLLFYPYLLSRVPRYRRKDLPVALKARYDVLETARERGLQTSPLVVP